LGALTLDNYIVNRVDRNSRGGGVASFIKVNLQPRPLTNLEKKLKEAGIEDLTLYQTADPCRQLLVSRAVSIEPVLAPCQTADPYQ